jgi:hypothetical protein
MHHRSQVIREQNRLKSTPIVPTFANKQPAPPKPQQIGVDQLVALLLSQGAGRGYTVQTSEADGPPVVRVNAQCGPLTIPLDFTPQEARDLSATIMVAADKLDPPPAEEEPVTTSPEAEALLAEFIAKADSPKCPGCERPLAGHELTNVDGTRLPDSYYCFPCMKIIQGGTFLGEPAPAESVGTSWIRGTAEPAVSQ